VASGAGKRLAVLLGPLVLITVVLPAAANAGPADLSPVLGQPTLQVSPELNEVRPGETIELTAHLSHRPATPVPITFELSEIDARPNFRRPAPPGPTLGCTVGAGSDSCSVLLYSRVVKTLVVQAWLSDAGLDGREGRLANLVLPPRVEADCRLEDGEPLDDQCRADGAGGVAPGAAEPDGTDVVLAGWKGLPDVLVDCDDQHPPHGTELEVRSTVERTVIYRCSVHSRATGQPIAGAPINAEIMGGPFDPDGGDEREFSQADYGERHSRGHSSERLCSTTEPQGHCQFEFKVPGEGAGQALLCLWADGDSDAVFGRGEFNGGGCKSEKADEAEGTDGSDAVLVELR
jgi:hypothetical protein